MMSGSLTLAVAGSFTGSYAAMANVGFQNHAAAPAVHHNFGSTGQSAPSSMSFSTSNVVHQAAGGHSGNFTHGLMNTWNAHTSAPSIVNAAANAHDLALNSTAALYTAASLAGFTDMTINVGGKQMPVSIGTKLTGAELVAVQQKLADGGQDLVINSRGVATGGVFDINNANMTALSTAVGGQIGSLYISHGVKAVDSLSNLNLLGNLVNMGSIVLGADAGAKGQTLDTISAVNIYNGFGGSISSALLGSLVPTSIALDASSGFFNAGKIVSAFDLNISAPNINNSGLLAATNGNVNFSGGSGANINLNNTNGTVQALNGNINFNQAGYAGLSNINVVGGNFLSNQLNFNAGTGTIEANMDDVTGTINGTAGCAHVTTATTNMMLGKMDVSGDPTYYNTAGDITINADISVVGANDLAVIASGNIIGNSAGKITTGTGQLNLVAGANFVAPGPTTGSSLPGGGGVATPVVIADSALTTKGSKTGGYIDLSGITLTNKATNSAISAVGTAGGNVLMVAYKGSGANSGSIVATRTSKQAAGATIVDAGTGTVTLVGGGAQITAQNLKGSAVSVFAEVPVINGGTMTFTNGNTPNTIDTTGKPTAAALNIGTGVGNAITATGNVTLSTAGKPSGTLAVPINLDAAGLSVTGNGATSSYFVNSTNGGKLTINNSNLASGATFNLKAAGDIEIGGNITGAGTIVMASPTGKISNTGGIIGGNSANLSSFGKIDVNTAVNTLTVASAAGGVNVAEGASSAKSLTLNASGGVIGQTFKVVSAQTLNVNGAIFGGDIDLQETGNTNAIGINVKAAMTSSTGKISLTTTGTDTITGSKPVVAADITINAGGNVGTAAAGFQTNASNSLTVNGTNANLVVPLVSIKDIGTGTLNLSGVTTGNAQNIQVTSAAATMNVGKLTFAGVTLSDTKVGGAINMTGVAAGDNVGNGLGAVKVTSAGTIDSPGANAQLVGTSVTLSATGTDIGGSSTVQVNTPILAASATKGKVSIQGFGAGPMTINAGSAKSSYAVTSKNLVVGGTISTTTVGTGSITLTANDTITQGPLTAVLSSANVNLVTLNAAGKIGTGTGPLAIQTKAVTSLSVNEAGAGSSGFVAQTGSIVIQTASASPGLGSSLNLALAAGNKLTVGGAAPGSFSFDNLTLTAPGSFVLGATGTVTSKNLVINSPIQTLTAGGTINVAANGFMSLTSPTTLTITGPTASVVVGSNASLTLSGQTNITLGNAVGGTNDPLATLINGGTLNNLTIFSKGVFTGAYSSLKTDTVAAGDTLSVTASSLKNSGAAVVTPYTLTSNNIFLNLTSGAPVTIGTVDQTNFNLISKTAGSTISAIATGQLKVDDAGLSFTGAGNSIALGGQTINTNLITDANYFTSTNNFTNVSLVATSSTFTVGAVGTTQLNNGILGSVAASNTGLATVGAPLLTVADTFSISGKNVTLNTSNLKLNGNSAIVGLGAASTLTIANNAAGGLVIGGTGGTNNIGGIYTGFKTAFLQSTNGGVNTGSLFTSLNGAGNMLDNNVLNNVVISAAGAWTLNPQAFTIGVASGGANGVFVNAASLSYPNSAKNPQPFLTLSADKGTVQLNLGTDINIGKTSKGQIDIQTGTTGTFSINSGGTLSINEVLNSGSGNLFGVNVAVNQNVTATTGLTVQASVNPTSSITEAAGVTLATSGNLFIGQGLVTAPVAPLNISTPSVVLTGGNLALNNTFAGSVVLQEVITSLPLYALSYVNAGKSGSNLLFGNMFASGNITIVNNAGSMSIGGSGIQVAPGLVPTVNPDKSPGAPVQSTGGNIVLQNNDLTGTITVGFGANVKAFASAPGLGLGNVSIVMGPVPTTGLAAGKPSSPFPTLNTAVNGGQIFLTTTANPNGSFTSTGISYLIANGANIIINGAGNNGAIILQGNNTIQADPPAVTHSTASLAANSAAIVVPAATVDTTSVNVATPVSTSTPISTTNWSLPTLAAIGSALNGVSANAAGLSDSTVLSGSGIVSGLPRAAKVASRVLTGGVTTSRDGVQTMERGVTLLSPTTQTTLKTSMGSVDVAAGAVAMIISNDDGMAVYNLHDTKNGAVVVNVGGKTVKLSPGQNVVLTSKAVSTFEEVNPAGRSIAYRRVTSKDWGNGVTGFHSEFSILSMLHNIGAVREMVKSNDAAVRKTVDAMLKTSAILLQLGGEKYEYMVQATPDLTAMNVK